MYASFCQNKGNLSVIIQNYVNLCMFQRIKGISRSLIIDKPLIISDESCFGFETVANSSSSSSSEAASPGFSKSHETEQNFRNNLNLLKQHVFDQDEELLDNVVYNIKILREYYIVLH